MNLHQQRAMTPADRPPRLAGWRLDLVIIALLLIGWLVCLAGPVLRLQPIGYDSYRDAACAEHMLAGRWSDDPALLGYGYWYPPLGPAAYALVSRVTQVPPLTLYGTSVLWVNVWILPALYLLVRRTFDPLTGVTAVLCVWLGSYWWSESLALPLPAVQGLVPALAALWLWVEMQGRGPRWAVVVGLLLAVCTWYHSICGMVACGAIGFHALICLLGRRADTRWQPVTRAAVAAGVCGILVAPLAWHLAALPRLNRVPIEFVPNAMFDPDYFRHGATPLMLPLAAVGLACLLRRARCRAGWVLGYLVVGLVGQAPAYLTHWTGRSFPRLVPHEFQWHGQLAVGVLAAVALVWLARAAVRYGGRRPAGSTSRSVPLAVGYAWACMVILTLGLHAGHALGRLDDRWIASAPPPAHAQAARWIKGNTSVYDVFLCRPETGYEVIGALTGRKLVAPRDGWANIAAPIAELHRDNQRMLDTEDPAEFRRLATEKHHLQYVFVDPELSDRLPRWRRWGLFDEVFTSADGRVAILRLHPSSVPPTE